MTKDATTSAVEKNNDTKPADKENVVNQTADTGNDTPDNVPYARFNELTRQNKKLQEKIKATKDKQEADRVASLEEQNKYQELYSEAQTKIADYEKKLEYHDKLEQEERESLLLQLPDEQRKIYEDLPTSKLRDHVQLTSKNTALRTDKSAPIRGNNLGIKNDADIWKMDKSQRQKSWGDVIRHFKKK